MTEAAIEEEASTIVITSQPALSSRFLFEELDPPYSDVATLLPVSMMSRSRETTNGSEASAASAGPLHFGEGSSSSSNNTKSEMAIAAASAMTARFNEGWGSWF